MNPLTVEWIDKAEGDYATAGRELRVRNNPNLDAVCFHAQQMAEKYMKAFLQEHGIVFPRIHNLIELLELCLPIDVTLEFQRPTLWLLNRYAVRYRYPGEWADRNEAQQAFRAATDFRQFMRARLGLP
jgi:HEPN domain-containing protein